MTLLENVGIGFAKESATTVLGQVKNMIENEITLIWGFKDDLKSFQEKFEMVEAMLAGDVGDTTKDRVRAMWLNKVKELMVVAEDVLDDYAYEMLRRKIQRQHQCVRPQKGFRLFRLKTKFRLFSCSSNPVLFRIKMAHKVKSLKDGLDHIFSEAHKLGIKPVEVTAHADGSGNRPSLDEKQLAFQRENVDCQGIMGRHKDKEEIISLLFDGQNRSRLLVVIGIYGMAGMHLHRFSIFLPFKIFVSLISQA